MGKSILSVLLGGIFSGIVSMSFAVNAETMQRMEALGIVNGSMAARNGGVEITAFLSGQPLFTSADVSASTPPLNTVLIEQTQLVSQDGNTVRIQRTFTLPQGGTGQWQLPIQVLVRGKPVTVNTRETSLGVQLTLPDEAQSVTVIPVGAAQLFLPITHRGDLSIDLRITGESGASEQDK
ncbi:TPA: DUF5462 family protein [Providencia rettgeri]